MNILDGLSGQLLAELVVQLILLALPLTALFLAVRSQRMARAVLKLGQVRRQMLEEAQRNGKRQLKIGEPSVDEASRAAVRELGGAGVPVMTVADGSEDVTISAT